jgi:D-beta-D-heptose 7-phosphate kinase/D-beta-D-heptose 1-phosphate adenosyltransferase
MLMDYLDFTRLKVVVLGDSIIDIYYHCKSDRIAPEGPFPVLAVDSTSRRLGGSLNVIANCLSLGALVFPLIVADQHELNSEPISSLLSNTNCISSLVFDQASMISYKTRTVAGGRVVSRMDMDNQAPLSSSLESAIIAKIVDIEPDLLILSDYNKGILSDSLILKLVKHCNDHAIPIFIDPKPRANNNVYVGATMLTPNYPELLTLLGQNPSCTADLASLLSLLSESYDVKIPLVTLGKDGVAVGHESLGLVTIPAEPVEVFDVTGAGDVFLSVVALCFSVNLPVEVCIKLASMAASESVKHIGNFVISTNLLLSLVRKSSLVGLLSRAVDTSSSACKTVFTNGCFDILHYGHVCYLQKARALGSRLIVGLNSDESVAKLKGRSRPINPLHARKALLEALSCVDLVVPFEETTPIELIKSIRPDILVKGGDYSAGDIVGREYAGETVVLPYITGFSSTNLLSRIHSYSE